MMAAMPKSNSTLPKLVRLDGKLYAISKESVGTGPAADDPGKFLVDSRSAPDLGEEDLRIQDLNRLASELVTRLRRKEVSLVDFSAAVELALRLVEELPRLSGQEISAAVDYLKGMRVSGPGTVIRGSKVRVIEPQFVVDPVPDDDDDDLEPDD